MSHRSSNSERIVIVGGGFAGLSTAARLAEAGLPVTLLESSKLGHAASTHNQGWLHSGAWFAKTDPHLARLCHESLLQTIKFSPESIEPKMGSMIYMSLAGQSDLDEWTQAWDQTGIPYQPLLSGERYWDLPRLNRDKVSWTMRLPDRSFRPDVLLSQLAAAARDAGAEIRPGTFVSGLLIDERRAYGVAVGANEEVRAQLVILATGAYSQTAFPQLYRSGNGQQSDYQLVCLKTHLRAIRPGIGAGPFCIVDGIGLNHLPHPGTSVFGTGRWDVVTDANDIDVDAQELATVEQQLEQLFPDGFGHDVEFQDWAGTTVQAMHLEQIEPGVAPLPTIINHSQEPGGIENVLSIFPGRATLWSHLADHVRTTVLERVGSRDTVTSQPPWSVNA